MEVVIYSFYKNWAMNITFICFAFVSAFSSQPIYTSGLIATINLFWSSYVIVAYALIEQDVSQETVLKHPALFRDTMTANRKSFMINQFWYIVEGTWHGLVIYFIPMYVMATPDQRGLAANWVEVGCTMYVALVITINLKLSMKTRYWTWITHLLTWLSVLTLFIFYYLYGLVFPIFKVEGTGDMTDIAARVFSLPQFWLAGVLLTPVMSLLPDLTRDAIQRLGWPRAYQIFQEREQAQETKEAAAQRLGL